MSFLLALLMALPAKAQTTSGTMSGSETWSGTVTLTGDVVVGNGTLTIQPGTVVRFATTNNNQVEGGPSTIFLIIQNNGALVAEGTAANPITFTTSSALPQLGNWGQIRLSALRNNPRTVFRYCLLEYAEVGIEMRNPSGNSQVSAPLIDNCTFRHFSMSGLYGTSGAEPTVTNCVFYDLHSSGIFMHGTGTVEVSHCLIYDASCGIIDAELTPYAQIMNVDHVTMYNLDAGLASYVSFWTGFGFFVAGNVGALSLTNSIIMEPDSFCVGLGRLRTAEEDYNCFYGGMGPVDGANMGPHSMDTDPLFQDVANRDFRLRAGSPCVNAASDGTHIGYWQGVVGINEGLPPAVLPAADITVLPNPFSEKTVIRHMLAARAGQAPSRQAVYGPDGRLIKEWAGDPARNQVVWDGRDSAGRRVEPGRYLYRLQTGPQSFYKWIVVIR